jgi:hypothetical protein
MSDEVQRLVVYGLIGPAAGHEFLAWCAAQDLPDPEFLMSTAGVTAFTGTRADRKHAMLQAVLAATVNNLTPDRWTAAMAVCVTAAQESSVDIPVQVVIALLRDGQRPPGAELPAGMSVFQSSLVQAGLMPT